MNILIPNATSPRNLGDFAILSGLLSLFDRKTKFKIHSTESRLYKKYFKKPFLPTLYSWAAFEDRHVLTRFKRVCELVVSFMVLKITNKMFTSNGLRGLLKDYSIADRVIFAGGGYLRSQKGIKQTLNLVMTLFLFQFAKLSKSKKIIAPISFGPFAYAWQEKYAAAVINGCDVIAAREQYSYRLLKKYRVKNVIRSYDAALFLNIKKKRKYNRKRHFILGFTIRKWLGPKEQMKFENDFVASIIAFSKSNNVVIQPIVQVDNPDYGDFDSELTDGIVRKLKNADVTVRNVAHVRNLEKCADVYSQIDLLLGMRMHSNILAALQGTPFVSISYEYNTEGMSKDLGLHEYCIKIEKVNDRILLAKLEKASKNIQTLRQKMNTSLEHIRSKEITRWKSILGGHLQRI